MERNSVTLNIILDKIRRNPLLADIPFETVVDWTVEFMEIEGFPGFFDEKVATIDIKDYKGELPEDCADVKGVRGFIDSHHDRPIAYRKATDTFMNSDHKRYRNDFTYKIQGKIIYTSTEKCELEIVYSAFQVDPLGFPMIPEHSKFSLALEGYIKVKQFEMLFEQGKLDPRVLDRADREYCWAVGRCESEFHKLSMDEAETLGNQWRQILINNNQHLSGYANLGVKKDFRIR